MTSGDTMRVVVATRSPLLTAGLVAALRAEDVDAHTFTEQHADGGAVWVVDTASQRRAQASDARMLVLREETEPGSSLPELDMAAGLDELLAALRDDRASRWVVGAEAEPASALDELSSREREIVEHVAKGWTNQQVAEELGISANTVRTHLQNIMAKVAVNNRRELAALVTEGA